MNSFDTALLYEINTLSNPILDMVFLFFTTLGNFESMTVITLALIILATLRKKYLIGGVIATSVIAATLLNLAIKSLVERDRPMLWQSIITETSYSFPSGHSMVSAALIITIIILCWNTRWRIATLVAGLGVMIMIGLSRLYFGVHYPTDVLVGWTLGAMIAWITVSIWRGASRRTAV